MSEEKEAKPQDSVSTEAANPNPEWADRVKWEAETTLKIRTQYEQLFAIWKEKELADLKAENDKTINDGLQKLFDKIKDEQKPPTHEQIQELLNQEYETFVFKVPSTTEDGEEREEMFTLRELPQAAEKRFYKQFRDKILDKASLLQAFSQAEMDMPFEEKAKAFLELFDETFDLLADAVVIVLNPFNKRKDITREWVQANISSDRQWRIAEAQISVNRLKDFFSRISQSGLQTQTIVTGQRFQQLQQLVR